jgi:isoleucyl-tRNA synthetase
MAAVDDSIDHLLPRHAVDPQQEFPALEAQVLTRWRERDVFGESLRLRARAPEWAFYEGPPTTNGPPALHHVLARVFKDLYPRYRTMRGYRVERKGGWDCHGLPVEIAVERELGIGTKAEIEAFGIDEFNARCRAAVFAYLEEWNRLTERIGFWIDLDQAYRTLDEDYIESVWWALAQIAERDLLYEGHKVVPYCPRCGTSLSSHELAQPGGYRDVEDPSLYVRLPVDLARARPASAPLQNGDQLLVWTTTPWTLVSNAAVAADPELQYVRARTPADGDGNRAVYVLAATRVEHVLGEQAEVLDRFAGRALDGAAYKAPFDFITADRYGPRGHTVLLGDFVTADDGTGLVHTAIAFGEDDFRLGAAYGLTVVNPVRLDGTFDERIGPYAGRFVKAADDDLVEDLRTRGRLLRSTRILHSYPHCWRCGTPLLYYAKPSWYIATSQLRERLLAANETVAWHPEHIKHGRFGDWLKNNVDWALSRERYWGTPLPVWRCAAGHVHVVGSFAELHERAGVEIADHHRPYVDDVEFPCADCRQPMRRVPEVIDVWFDSGAMPFAQHHAPFENQQLFRERFPADFICEALDQTRGWFYSLLAISTLLYDQAPYENVVCLGLIVDGEGQKMSKSRGNTIEPWEVIDAYGADALRWYFFTSKQPWDGYRFSPEILRESTGFLRQLWNSYYFYGLYASVNAGALADGSAPARTSAHADLDAWVLSRLSGTAATVAERLDAYDATSAGRAIADFVDDLSNWYVRRSRPRFWAGEREAFETLRQSLLGASRLLAPFAPFVADEIYDNLDGTLASVHLSDFPAADALPRREQALEGAMAVARETVRLGLAARRRADVRVRQPLAEAVIVASGAEREAIARLADIVREELNVRGLRFVSGADELVRYEVKPNYRTLGPRFGRAMPRVAAAVEALDPPSVAQALREQTVVGISVDGRDHQLEAGDLFLSMSPLEGYSMEREGSHAVALELALDESLRREGLAREIVHAVQAARKNAGLAVEDRIALALRGDELLLAAARTHEAYVSGETLAVEVTYEPNGAAAAADFASEAVMIEGRELVIALHPTGTAT